VSFASPTVVADNASEDRSMALGSSILFSRAQPVSLFGGNATRTDVWALGLKTWGGRFEPARVPRT
jgi:hypothetical protein